MAANVGDCVRKWTPSVFGASNRCPPGQAGTACPAGVAISSMMMTFLVRGLRRCAAVRSIQRVIIGVVIASHVAMLIV